jgi:hypothetical protein
MNRPLNGLHKDAYERMELGKNSQFALLESGCHCKLGCKSRNTNGEYFY